MFHPFDPVAYRMIFSAHTHQFCDHIHVDGTREVTIPAMSWEARNDPAFIVATFRPNNIVTEPLLSCYGIMYTDGLCYYFGSPNLSDIYCMQSTFGNLTVYPCHFVVILTCYVQFSVPPLTV